MRSFIVGWLGTVGVWLIAGVVLELWWEVSVWFYSIGCWPVGSVMRILTLPAQLVWWIGAFIIVLVVPACAAATWLRGEGRDR